MLGNRPKAFLAVLALWLPAGLTPPGAVAQEATALIDRDARLFAISAALNAAGFDVELASQYHPVRQLLRENLRDVDPDLLRRLGEFYSAGGAEGPAGNAAGTDAELASYISLALNVSAPPALEPLYDADRIPLDARRVQGLLPLARELFVAADLGALWRALEPSYDAVLETLAPPIREALVGAEAYLRVASGGLRTRRALILLELSLPVNSVNLRNYPDNMYVVLGAAADPPINEIRHGYLHVLLDPLVAERREGDLGRAAELLDLVEDTPGVRADYLIDTETMVGESLIRAIEIRIRGAGAEGQGPEVDRAYREGLLLAPYFHEGLQVFEPSGTGIRQYLPELFDRLDIEVERERFAAHFDTIPVPESQPVRAEVPSRPLPDPVRELLAEAQAAFNEQRNEAAAVSFRRVLEELDPENGPALYGLALLASRSQDPDRAREYFSRTLASETAEPDMVVWSHVYLGRIEDLSCNREAALNHYRNAVGAGNDTGGAQAAARQGLEAQYGGNC